MTVVHHVGLRWSVGARQAARRPPPALASTSAGNGCRQAARRPALTSGFSFSFGGRWVHVKRQEGRLRLRRAMGACRAARRPASASAGGGCTSARWLHSFSARAGAVRCGEWRAARQMERGASRQPGRRLPPNLEEFSNNPNVQVSKCQCQISDFTLLPIPCSRYANELDNLHCT